jgi:ADP-heptose:LPS heptosyltransferase
MAKPPHEISDTEKCDPAEQKREKARTDSRRLKSKWDASDLSGKRILVIGENGVGDEVLTASCIHDLMPSCEHVIWRCDPKLQRLLARSFPKVEFITEADGKPADVHVIYSWELIGRFRPSRDKFNWLTSGEFVSYLQFPQGLRDKLRQRYSGETKILVGLAWRSERDGETVADKTCDLLDVPHWKDFFDKLKDKVRFISLQYGDTQTELDFVRWKYGVEIYQDQRVNIYDDIDAAAAQIAAMDFVVTISTMAAHLAGALGIRGWLMLPQKPFPHWQAGKNICPWYPALQPVQQTKAGDWQPVIERVTELCQETLSD